MDDKVNEMGDDEVMAQVRAMEIAERVRLAQESMAGERTFTVNGEQVTMSEHDWFVLFGEVSVGCKWATQVMTWSDMERILAEHVGFSDATYEQLDTPEKRKKELFDEGIATTETWLDPDASWKPSTLAAGVLREMGYFDNPIDMMQWIMRVEGAPDEVLAALAEAAGMMDDDDRGDE